MENQLLTTTQAVDPVFIFILGCCFLLLLGITAAMIYFVIRYHRSRAPQPTSQRDGSLWLEVVWTALPTLLVIGMFYYGWSRYLVLREVPTGALKATAVARMWSWEFQYENGKTSDVLYIPVGKPVEVDLQSKDVIHGFFMPAFRIKRDVVPGMKNHVWFVADKAGSYDIFCSQYCGTGHSAMIAKAQALPPEQFAKWLSETTNGAENPAHELLEKYGCLGCHTEDGTKKVGPTFKGLYGSKVKVTVGGKEAEVVADDAYLHESIVAPAAKIVVGYPPVMPAQTIPEAEVKVIVDYLKNLK
ncbi:cytochrome c oxidase subunit II [Geomonas sp.]|uniref:cytochrome c oxidase subunit II n=1 Tax=Geomonas sp. TaxID=2651584 RepID=UPI002B46DEED|nr:cytochrome c oxidase subunit II [Geomonas sp.]HJV33875.1 cytochrome c oxidase subunit II [Geomonas sp.]